ncbi:MAG TPA: PSD1 and planctomycete cytochrome C domain-containing protein [Pirellulales bacterium]
MAPGWWLSCVVVGAWACCGLPAVAAAPVDFAHDVAPIFAAHCMACHGGEKQESGLRLDHRAAAMQGGDSGPAIVAGASSKSELWHRIASNDADEQMPPSDGGKALSAEQISLLKTWIDQGAVWPESADTSSPSKSSHWAYQPVSRPAVPKVKNTAWTRSPIDAFIAGRLERENIAPSPDAPREVLLRRVFLDLVGLLPTADERTAFLADTRPDAYERLVDRLLASPHFGERWGRHWLDLARYGDSNGYELDIVRPNAWRYRDWVVDAFNRDLPYDRFITEQIAGDLLPGAGLRELAATGFHRMTIKNTESGINDEDYRNREMIDRVNTTSAAVLGLTMGCAQCHSHKYDPISQQEYYHFYAFFNNVEEVEIDLPGTPAERAAFRAGLTAHIDLRYTVQGHLRLVEELLKQGPAKSRAALEATYEAARLQLESQRKLQELGLERWYKEVSPKLRNALRAPAWVTSSLKPGAKPKSYTKRSVELYFNTLDLHNERLAGRLDSLEAFAHRLDEPAELIDALLVEPADRKAAQRQLIEDYCEGLPARKDELTQRLRMLAVEERYLPSPHLLALKESTAGRRTTHVLLRGDFKQLGPTVEPATPAVLPPLATRGKQPDRLDLARWLTDEKNPLTARVAVNHLWTHLFGRGIVSTVDNFGVQGERPSHPELLDWLADELMRGGWSRKALVRQIVLSSAYRQASRFRGELEARDPLNTLVARQGRFRVEAEIARDVFLSASGLLDRTVGGPTIYPAISDAVRDIAYKFQLVWPTSPAPVCYRRGLYIHFRRSNPYPSLMMFDAPEGTVCTAQRNRSNTPLQALATLNDPVFVENAQALGRRVLAEASADPQQRVRMLFVDCLGREPSHAEASVLADLAAAELKAYLAEPRQAVQLAGAHAGNQAQAAEQAAWIAVARAVMNLDEFLTRE